jgi:Putative HNHc nuclease
MIEKKKRVQDESVKSFYRGKNCVICGAHGSDPCHIKSVGSGGDDTHDNIVNLCRAHHIEQHSIGFFKMCEKYPFFRQILAQKGWQFDGNKKLRRF